MLVDDEAQNDKASRGEPLDQGSGPRARAATVATRREPSNAGRTSEAVSSGSEDPQILAAALGNLLQNAFKFSRVHGHVALRTTATDARVRIEVEDEDEDEDECLGARNLPGKGCVFSIDLPRTPAG